MESKKFNDFYEAWWFLNETSVFKPTIEDWVKTGCSEDWAKVCQSYDSFFSNSLDIIVVKVCPNSKRVMKNEKRNTHVQIWLECGEPYYDEGTNEIKTYHNIKYDCGGDTFEEAIVYLANIVYEENKEKIGENSEQN